MWLVRSWPTPSLGFRLKVADYMSCKRRLVVRAGVKKYTPAGLTLSIRIAVSAVKDFWVACTVHRQVKVDTLKYAR